MMLKKNVLFIGIGFYDYDKAIIEQFKELGYQVDYYSETPPNSYKLRYNLRLGNTKQVHKIAKKHCLSIAQKVNTNYEYVFVIKGDNLTIEAISLIKNKNPTAKWVLYLWDSIKRNVNYHVIASQFNEIYSFDRIDCINYSNLIFNPLFYRKEYYECEHGSQQSTDLYFLGWYHSDRLKLIEKLSAFCNQNHLKCKMLLYTGFFSYMFQKIFGGELKHNKSFLVYKPISAQDNIKNILNSKCTLDIAHPLQSGLTMRTIELLAAQKKIITTNDDIVNYDFYKPENVLIIDRNDPKLDTDFFNIPYNPINNDIVQQYSLYQWLSRMLK